MRPKTLPTTDLYFLNSCGHLVHRWGRSGPIRRLGANSFVCGNTFVLIRRDTPALMRQAIDWGGKLIYLLDDDIEGATESPSLPTDYRRRLTQFATEWLDPILRRADQLATSCEPLEAKYRADPRVGAAVSSIDPFWKQPFADGRHYTGLPAKRLEIVHLGSASHSAALAAATPAIVAVLDRSVRTRFTYIGVRGAHPILESHPRARRLTPMRWHRYRRWLPGQRFHLALYPLENSPFDQARSTNKVIEHAIVGAVGVYPRNWSGPAASSNGWIAAPEDPHDWGACLMEAIEQADRLSAYADQMRADLISTAVPAKQQRFWSQHLGLE